MELDESHFGSVCTNIISADPTPDIGEIYNKIIREEQRLSSSRDRENQQGAVGFVTKKEPSMESTGSGQNRTPSTQCAHCGRNGHEKENCWQLVGFPDWWEERTQNRAAGRSAKRGGRGRGGSFSDRSRNASPRINAAHATSSNFSTFPEFTQEQWKALTQMLNERTNPSSLKLSRKFYNGDLILDTGASHHMTGDISLLEKICIISPWPVSFADGNKTFATHT